MSDNAEFYIIDIHCHWFPLCEFSDISIFRTYEKKLLVKSIINLDSQNNIYTYIYNIYIYLIICIFLIFNSITHCFVIVK